MTDNAILEFKTASVSDRIRAMQQIRHMSNTDLARFVANKTGRSVSSSDLTNILAGKVSGPAAEEKLQVMRELFQV